MDYTGTGNSLNLRHPQTLHLVMDSLRYWVQEMTSTASASPAATLRASSTRSTGSPPSST